MVLKVAMTNKASFGCMQENSTGKEQKRWKELGKMQSWNPLAILCNLALVNLINLSAFLQIKIELKQKMCLYSNSCFSSW